MKAVSHSGRDTSADSGLYKKEGLGSTQGRGQLAKGKRAALFQVHFEGNLGDQMETIPLLQRLYEWGMEVDCYLRYDVLLGTLSHNLAINCATSRLHFPLLIIVCGGIRRSVCPPLSRNAWRNMSQTFIPMAFPKIIF